MKVTKISTEPKGIEFNRENFPNGSQGMYNCGGIQLFFIVGEWYTSSVNVTVINTNENTIKNSHWVPDCRTEHFKINLDFSDTEIRYSLA